MQNKVILPLAVVVRLTDPPDTVESVRDYISYIRELLTGDAGNRVKRPVGRPPKAAGIQKLGYTGDELAAIDRYIKAELYCNPLAYTHNGILAKGLADNQPGDPTLFALDNMLMVEFSDRVPVIDGGAFPTFPPSIHGM